MKKKIIFIGFLLVFILVSSIIYKQNVDKSGLLFESKSDIKLLVEEYYSNIDNINGKIVNNSEKYCYLSVKNEALCFLSECEYLKRKENDFGVYYEGIKAIENSVLESFVNYILDNKDDFLKEEYYIKNGISEDNFSDETPSKIIFYLYKKGFIDKEKSILLLDKTKVLLSANQLTEKERYNHNFYYDIIVGENQTCKAYLEKIKTY